MWIVWLEKKTLSGSFSPVCFLLPVLVKTLRLHHNSLGLDRGVSFAAGIRLFLTFPQRLCRLLRFPSSLRAASFPVRFLAWRKKKSLRGVAVIVFLTSSVQFSVAPWWNRLRSYAYAWRCARRLPPRTAAPDRRNWCHFQTLAALTGLWRWKLRGKWLWVKCEPHFCPETPSRDKTVTISLHAANMIRAIMTERFSWLQDGCMVITSFSAADDSKLKKKKAIPVGRCHHF